MNFSEPRTRILHTGALASYVKAPLVVLLEKAIEQDDGAILSRVPLTPLLHFHLHVLR